MQGPVGPTGAVGSNGSPGAVGPTGGPYQNYAFLYGNLGSDFYIDGTGPIGVGSAGPQLQSGGWALTSSTINPSLNAILAPTSTFPSGSGTGIFTASYNLDLAYNVGATASQVYIALINGRNGVIYPGTTTSVSTMGNGGPVGNIKVIPISQTSLVSIQPSDEIMFYAFVNAPSTGVYIPNGINSPPFTSYQFSIVLTQIA